MTMSRFTEDLEAFHIKYGLEYTGMPRMLPGELLEFRVKFLQEELREYIDHISQENQTEALVQSLDALVDLVYVAIGTAYLHGFSPVIFDEAWRRVQEANMSKVRAERASDSKRGSTFDVVKPSGWTPPDHTDLVNGVWRPA